MGSEGSSRPALRTYFVEFILRESQSTSANFLDFVGEGKIVVRWRRCELCREARNRYLPGKVRKAVAYV